MCRLFRLRAGRLTGALNAPVSGPALRLKWEEKNKFIEPRRRLATALRARLRHWLGSRSRARALAPSGRRACPARSAARRQAPHRLRRASPLASLLRAHLFALLRTLLAIKANKCALSVYATVAQNEKRTAAPLKSTNSSFFVRVKNLISRRHPKRNFSMMERDCQPPSAPHSWGGQGSGVEMSFFRTNKSVVSAADIAGVNPRSPRRHFSPFRRAARKKGSKSTLPILKKCNHAKAKVSIF